MPIDLPYPRRGRPTSPPTTPIMLRLPVDVVDRLAAAYTSRGLAAPPVQVAIRQALDWWLSEHEITIPAPAAPKPAVSAAPEPVPTPAPAALVAPPVPTEHNSPAPALPAPVPRRRTPAP